MDIDLRSISQTYLLSNNGSFFYKELSRRDDIHFAISQTGMQKLILDFTKLSKGGIRDLEQLCLSYAIYFCILNKRILTADEEKSKQTFLGKEGDVEFEWFPVFREEALQGDAGMFGRRSKSSVIDNRLSSDQKVAKNGESEESRVNKSSSNTTIHL
jgi:hypothetical protein